MTDDARGALDTIHAVLSDLMADDEGRRIAVWLSSSRRFTECWHGIPYDQACPDCGPPPF